LLHYVGFAAEPSGTWALQPNDCLRTLLDNGTTSLSLSTADAATALRNHTFKADEVLLGPDADSWDTATFNALARHCKHGARVRVIALSQRVKDALSRAGFQSHGEHFAFAPAWEPKLRGGQGLASPAVAVGDCVVVGAGISGASVANALACRGWQVTVVDRCSDPAGGASGLPVGLVVPHCSADDNPRSRMSRNGVGLILEHAARALQSGQDWAPSGVLEMRWDMQGEPTEPLLHGQAAWIRPSRLVHSWLQHPHIKFQGDCDVHALQRCGTQWVLEDASGGKLAQADLVVFANAAGCSDIVLRSSEGIGLTPQAAQQLMALQTLYGTLTLGRGRPAAQSLTDLWPSTPCNGDGSFIADIPTSNGTVWAAGSTFETDAHKIKDTAAQHRANLERLRRLLPDVAHQLAPQWDSGAVSAWSGARCVSHDRFPLVGPLHSGDQPTVWMCAAMGSRGLSFSALCAQLLAARLHAEPLPLTDRLAAMLDSKRHARRIKPLQAPA
jgi:tRNA 5-methylaminomethyl-2-thiouridine biosynthesis bifunctional protein